MHKNPKAKPVPTKKFLEYAVRTKSWQTVARHGWLIKFSSYKETTILLFIVSQYTGQTFVRYFGNEDEACNYINYLIELDPQVEHEL